MGGEGLAILIALALLVSLVLFYRRRDRPESEFEAPEDEHDLRGLPEELRRAPMVYAEQEFRSHSRKLVARLDRAYRIDGRLKLVEFKTRSRNAVYRADVIELSVQRIAVQDETGQPVSKDAWVVVESTATGERESHRVRLLDTREITDMRARYIEISQGTLSDLQPARSTRQCESCGHRERCIAKFGAHRSNRAGR